MGNQYEMCSKIIEESISRWEVEFLRKKGICRECYTENKGLIKQDDHYVPWKYQNFATTEEDKPMVGDYIDCNIILPKISWCEKYKKRKLEFQGADSGGYDVETFVWYFDKKKILFRQ